MPHFDSQTTSLKRATFINAVSKYLIVILNILFSAVLARLLSPTEYGIVAIITVFTNFFYLFSDMGLSTAVIQYKSLSADDENRIFTFSIYLGIALGIIFSVCSIFLDQIYNTDVYYKIGPLLGITLAFRTFNMIPNARLMKTKRFLQSALRNVVTSATGYVAAVVIALLGGSYYALIAQALITAVFIFVWNLNYTKLKFNSRKVMDSIKIILKYSSYQFGFNFVNYFAENLDNLLVGLFFGDIQLGYYDKAYQLMKYPINNLTNVISPSIQPILSDHQQDPEYVFQKYIKMAKFLALIGVYVSCICYFASKEIILLYFGSQWEGSVNSFHYLSVSLVFQITGFIAGSIFQSLNRAKAMFWSGIIGTVIIVTGILTGIHFGSIHILALCFSISAIVNFIKSQWFLSRFCFNISIWKLLTVYRPEIIMIAAMVLSLLFIPTLENLFMSLAIKICVGTAVYLIMLWITKEYRILVSILPGKVQNKLPKWLQI